MISRKSVGEWSRFLASYDELYTKTFVRVNGRLPHPSEVGFFDSFDEEDDVV